MGSRTTLSGSRHRVTLEAAHGAGLVDLMAVLVGPDRRVRGDHDVVFYNNPTQPGVVLREDGGFDVDLDRVPLEIHRIVVVGLTEPQGVAFDAVRGLAAGVAGASGTLRFAPPALTTETVVMLVALYRRGEEWKLDAVGQGYRDGFAAFAADHGIEVAAEPAIEHKIVLPPPAEVVPAPARSAPVPAAGAPGAPPPPPQTPPPPPPMLTEAQRRWHETRARGDVDALVETVLAAHDAGDLPAWLDEARRDLVDDLVQELSGKLDDPDTPLGYQLVRLSSACGPDPALALLGLASVCVQDQEQGGVLNEEIPSLLRSQLSLVDIYPPDAFPPYTRVWRELAVRRTEILVRVDWARQVNAVRERYLENVRMAQMVLVYEVASSNLAGIRRVLPLLRDAHRDLSFYLPLIEHHAEKAELAEDLELLENLIDAGVDTLNTPRR